jgi:excisionase family DNA binding protein
LTTAEVAELARVDERTVREAVKSGALPAIRLAPGHRLLRYDERDVAAWLRGEPTREDDDAPTNRG